MSAGLFSSVPLVAVSRVLDVLVSAASPIEPAALPIDEAEALFLAEALVAAGPVPPRPVALRPGWAVEARTTAGAGPYSPILSLAEPEFVTPGAFLPPGTDAVLAPEALAQSGGSAEIGEAVAPGEGVRRAGEDAAPGAELCPAGMRLSALHIAAAREAGIDRCRVRRAHVGFASRSKDPRAALLERFAVTRGAAASRGRTDGEGWAGALSGQAAADLVVVLDPDGAAEALSRAEATILGRLAARPGEGTVCALLDGKPVLVVGPGLAEAAAAGLLVLGPWLERVTGGRRPLRRSGRLARKLASSVGLTEIALVRSLGLEFEPLAVADLTLTALARADAFVIVPPECEGWPAGAMVEAVEF